MEETFKQVVTYLNKFQMELDPKYLIDRMILHKGYWEQRVIGYLNNFVKPGMCVVDVGANAGYHTLLMAGLVGEKGQVLAFEPNAEARLRLLANLELNPQLQTRVRVSSLGLGAKPEKLFLKCEDNPLNLGNASLVRDVQMQNLVAVDVVKLDDFLVDEVALLKIDVEGMELQVLEGATRHLERDRPTIIFETLRSVAPEEHKKIEDFLKPFGYRIFVSNYDGTSLEQISYPNYPYEDSVAMVL